MSRNPPCLLYLAIYNPTLRIEHPTDDDDEDAEEQAQILFHTSKERAVSRDRMLRQIGLAKALVNFAELFDPNSPCESVHSQTRRMVMVSPEPDFWMNASVELPKIPQAPSATAKTSGSSKKGKGKEPSNQGAATIYDYEEGTIHDLEIRARLLEVYERFKLLHGSFASILSTLGREALELQLERFFTVWAWSWNLEDKPDIVAQLGTPLHPYFSTLVPLLDGYSSLLPEGVIPVALSHPYIIPSTRYTSAHLTLALAQHLLSIIPPPSLAADDQLASSVDTLKALNPDPKPNAAGLFGIPPMNVNMDMRKWNWGYLTFGKGSSGSSKAVSPASSVKEEQDEEKESTQTSNTQHSTDAEEDTTKPSPTRSSVEVQVDPGALEEALSSDGLSMLNANARIEDPPPSNTGIDLPAGSKPDPPERSGDGESQDGTVENAKLFPGLHEAVSSSPKSSITVSPPLAHFPSRPPTPPLPEFSVLTVHIAPNNDPTTTRRRTIHYFIRNEVMLALLGVDDIQPSQEDPGQSEDAILLMATQHAVELLDNIDLTIQNAASSKLSESLPSAKKILQPSDQYIISTSQYTLSSSLGFSSDASHLQNAKELLRRDSGVTEVFSRGQNPQHWHVVKRGLCPHDSTEDEQGHLGRGEMYLEVFRKEARLPDVDNVLASLLRKSGIAESGMV